MPKKEYNQQGYVVIDMHAEVLARRALLRYLIKDASGPANFLTKSVDGNQFTFNTRKRLHLFTSRTPCGDSSMI